MASGKSTGDIRKCFMVIRRIHIPPRSLRRERIFGTATSNGSPAPNISSALLAITIGKTKVR